MPIRKPADVVRAFIQAVNSHDTEKLARTLSEDHTFTDSLGRIIRGRERLQRAWAAYFFLFPDYRISVVQTLEKRNVVSLFGIAAGTYRAGGRLRRANHWSVPAAWRAVVRRGLLAEWQVYADNEPLRRILEAHTR